MKKNRTGTQEKFGQDMEAVQGSLRRIFPGEIGLFHQYSGT